MENSKYSFESLLSLLLAILTIFTLKAIFENESSKIISSKGESLLQDADEMKKINNKINQLEKNNHHQEILI